MTTTLQATGTIPTVVPLMNRCLISEQLWARLTGRVRKSLEFQAMFGDLDSADQDLRANWIVDQALGYLVACARTGLRLPPSEAVDIGWHNFILYTKEYTEFCHATAGRYLHHDPSDREGVDYSGDLTIGDTIQAMQDSGVTVIPDVWFSQAHSLVTCTGNEGHCK